VSPEDRRAAWAHLRHLAETNRIRMHPTKRRWASEAHQHTRQVFVPRRMSEVIDYLVALHEFGHILSTLANRLVTNHTPLERLAASEGAAWAWAVQNAEPELLEGATDKDWELIGSALVSHIRHL
jgi:hypothetical protein